MTNQSSYPVDLKSILVDTTELQSEFLSGKLVNTCWLSTGSNSRCSRGALPSRRSHGKRPSSSEWAVLKEVTGGLSGFSRFLLACCLSLVFANGECAVILSPGGSSCFVGAKIVIQKWRNCSKPKR